MTNQLNQILKMISNKENFFMIIECAESIGFDLTSRSIPGLKIEVTNLIEHAKLNEEAESLTITF